MPSSDYCTDENAIFFYSIMPQEVSEEILQNPFLFLTLLDMGTNMDNFTNYH